MAGALEGDVFIGPQAQQYRGLFKINYPLEHGIVTDWDDMERIWQYVYTEELKTVSEDVSRWDISRHSSRPIGLEDMGADSNFALDSIQYCSQNLR
jgi:hypothetical protein